MLFVLPTLVVMVVAFALGYVPWVVGGFAAFLLIMFVLVVTKAFKAAWFGYDGIQFKNKEYQALFEEANPFLKRKSARQ